MKTLAARWVCLLRDERGATVIEYAFIAGFVSLSIIAGATQIGQTVKGFFEAVGRGFG